MKNFIFTILFSLISASFFAQKSNSEISKLYQNYIKIKDALASDNKDLASVSAEEFLKTASTIDYKVLSEGNVSALKKDAAAISEAKTLAKQRSYFYNLSDNFLEISKEYKLSGKPVFVQYCPMAEGSWLSNEKNIVNPYYGAEMLTCGTVKFELK